MEYPPRSAGDSEDIEILIGGLEEMSCRQLKRFWEERWGLSPRLQSKPLLRAFVAWRLQTERWGGLNEETLTKLRGKRAPRAAAPPVGTRVTREYQGVLHHAEVEALGVRYDGVLYRSLSDVAEAITGTRWNGPRFFGLRRRDQHG